MVGLVAQVYAMDECCQRRRVQDERMYWSVCQCADSGRRDHLFGTVVYCIKGYT